VFAHRTGRINTVEATDSIHDGLTCVLVYERPKSVGDVFAEVIVFLARLDDTLGFATFQVDTDVTV
jgi:hypothetical protein